MACAARPEADRPLGDCAATGGLFAESYACVGAVDNVVPVGLRIPGGPPRPIEILAGLVTLPDAARRTRQGCADWPP